MLAVSLSALALPVVVLAESKVEPHSSSPAGAVYEIPLQTARDYGAPGGGTGGGAPGTAGGAATAGQGTGGGGVLPQGSAVKSENGYGSSSRVPGLTAKAAAAETAAKATAASAHGTTHPKSNSAAPPRIQATPASSDAPSVTGAYALVILIAIGGAAAGIAAAMATRGLRHPR